ncbi:hypothetical protein V500_00835 [Pseudogymnoascus sp. VKM F-4518 (FW-2643)]|nr:hypothetical protein V500_00835 [Pseudogymnoascus sp. VKM F-4518 (FW-2643)]
MAQTARLVAIYAEQRSAGHHPVIPAVDHTPQFSGAVPPRAALFNKQLSKHSTGAYIDLCNGAGVHFKAVLAEGAADYGQQTRLVATSIAFDALEKSREHLSSDTVTSQLSAKEWRERFNAELAIREALEIEMMGIKGENAELQTGIKALREAEATRIQELEKAREILLITSRILQERALKASEDSQKITHAATSLKLGSNPYAWPISDLSALVITTCHVDANQVFGAATPSGCSWENSKASEIALSYASVMAGSMELVVVSTEETFMNRTEYAFPLRGHFSTLELPPCTDTLLSAIDYTHTPTEQPLPTTKECYNNPRTMIFSLSIHARKATSSVVTRREERYQWQACLANECVPRSAGSCRNKPARLVPGSPLPPYVPDYGENDEFFEVSHIDALHNAPTKQKVESMAVQIPGMGHAFDTYAEEGGMVDKVLSDAVRWVAKFAFRQGMAQKENDTEIEVSIFSIKSSN